MSHYMFHDTVKPVVFVFYAIGGGFIRYILMIIEKLQSEAKGLIQANKIVKNAR